MFLCLSVFELARIVRNRQTMDGQTDINDEQDRPMFQLILIRMAVYYA